MVSNVIEKSTNNERFVTLAGRLPQQFSDQDLSVVVRLRGRAQDIKAAMGYWHIEADHLQMAHSRLEDCVVDGMVKVEG